MCKNKIHSFREGVVVAFAIIVLVLGVAAVILFCLSNGNDGFYQASIIVSVFSIISLFCLLLSFCFDTTVYLDSETITVKSFIFKSKLKQEKWSDLQKAEIRLVYGRGGSVKRCICLFFNNQGMNYMLQRDMTEMPGVVIVDASKKNIKILREYLPDELKFNLDVDIREFDKKEIKLSKDKRRASKRKTRLFMYGDLIGKGAIIITSIPFCISTVTFIIGVILVTIDQKEVYSNILTIGCVLMLICALIFVYVLLGSTCIFVDSDSIGMASVLKNNISEEKWSDLQKVEIKYLKGFYKGEYLCLWFKNLMINYNDIRELLKCEGIIVVALTDKNKQILIDYLPERFKKKLYGD